MEKTPKNFAIWTALNSEYIYFFSSEPSYYGSPKHDAEQSTQQKLFIAQNKIPIRYGYAEEKDVLKTIRKIGIDWNNSSLPESQRVAEFQGTFCDSEYKDIVNGVLVLIDGTEIDYYAECKLDMNQFTTMQKFFDQCN